MGGFQSLRKDLGFMGVCGSGLIAAKGPCNSWLLLNA